jgi:glutathione S-transferase
MSLKLFYAPGACSLAAHIALREAGADFELARVDLAGGEQHSEAYRSLNPLGRVPLLATERGSLTEAPAILAWIAQTWPEAGLAPLDDPWALAQVLSFNNYLSSSVHIAFATLFRPQRFADGDEAAAAMKAKAPETLDQLFTIIDRKIGRGSWVHGADYTTSDLYLLVMTRWLKRVGHDLNRYPALISHAERTLTRPAVQAAFEAEGIRFA